LIYYNRQKLGKIKRASVSTEKSPSNMLGGVGRKPNCLSPPLSPPLSIKNTPLPTIFGSYASTSCFEQVGTTVLNKDSATVLHVRKSTMLQRYWSQKLSKLLLLPDGIFSWLCCDTILRTPEDEQDSLGTVYKLTA